MEKCEGGRGERGEIEERNRVRRGRGGGKKKRRRRC